MAFCLSAADAVLCLCFLTQHMGADASWVNTHVIVRDPPVSQVPPHPRLLSNPLTPALHPLPLASAVTLPSSLFLPLFFNLSCPFSLPPCQQSLPLMLHDPLPTVVVSGAARSARASAKLRGGRGGGTQPRQSAAR
eukprot:3813941-Rhodomonas_salina.2